MSPVYRMIHGLDEEKPKFPRASHAPSGSDDTIYGMLPGLSLYSPSDHVTGNSMIDRSRVSSACTPAPASIVHSPKHSNSNSNGSPAAVDNTQRTHTNSASTGRSYSNDGSTTTEGSNQHNGGTVTPSFCRINSDIWFNDAATSDANPNDKEPVACNGYPSHSHTNEDTENCGYGPYGYNSHHYSNGNHSNHTHSNMDNMPSPHSAFRRVNSSHPTHAATPTLTPACTHRPVTSSQNVQRQTSINNNNNNNNNYNTSQPSHHLDQPQQPKCSTSFRILHALYGSDSDERCDDDVDDDVFVEDDVGREVAPSSGTSRHNLAAYRTGPGPLAAPLPLHPTTTHTATHPHPHAPSSTHTNTLPNPRTHTRTRRSTQQILQSQLLRRRASLDNPQPRGVQAPREDEQTFTSLNSTGKIPSKSFQRLQQFTDQAPPPSGSPQGSVDTSSIRHTLNPQDEADGGIGDYAQASIRYMGRNIPSKSFRMLQNLTGGPDNTPAPARQPRRQRRPVEQPAPDTNPDEGVDISYVGGNIPSKTFQLLQCSMGEEPAMPPEHYDDGGGGGKDDDRPYSTHPRDEYHQMSYTGAGDPSQHQDVTEPQVVRRRGRTRAAAPPKPAHTPANATTTITTTRNTHAKETNIDDAMMDDFDEEAYLAGKVNILKDSSDLPRPPRNTYSPSREQPEPWVQDEYNRVEQKSDDFDEEAYLKGKVAIFGDEPKLHHASRGKEEDELPEWQVKRNSGHFDGIPNFDEDSFISKSRESTEEVPEWKAKYGSRTNLPEDCFNENAYLKGCIPVVKGGPVDMSSIADDSTDNACPEHDDQDHQQQQQEFDEDKFLGRLPKAANVNAAEFRPFSRDPELASWQKRRPIDSEGDDSSGVITTPQVNHFTRNAQPYRPEQNGLMRSDGERVPPGRRVTVIRRAPSTGSTTSIDTSSSYCDSDKLDGGVGGGGSSVEGGDHAYKNMVYVGRKIPSKTFMKLQKSVNVHKPLTDIELAEEKARGRCRSEDEGIDMCDVTDKGTPGTPSSSSNDVTAGSPDVGHVYNNNTNNKDGGGKYMQNLKDTMNSTKIELENEVTDF